MRGYDTIPDTITKEWPCYPALSYSPSTSVGQRSVEGIFQISRNSYRFARSIDQEDDLPDLIKQIGIALSFPLPFFPFYIHEPLTLSRGWTAITGEEEFSRETLGHTFLSNSLLPVTPITDPKSLRNEWEKSRGWLADKRRVEIGNKERSILGDGCRRGRDKTDRLHWSTVYRTRGIAQIHPLGSYRALIGSPNTILTSLDPAWKPQLTNGRSDLCRFPDTSSDDKLPDRAGILTQTSPWLPTGWLTTRQRTRPCRQTWPSTELSSLWRNAISPLEHRSDSGLTD